MANSVVNQIKVGSTTYDMKPYLNSATSGDSTTATSWTAVSTAVTNTDSYDTVFNKITTMVRNVRYLYNKLGTTDFSAVGSTTSAALVALNNGKSATTHTHSNYATTGHTHSNYSTTGHTHSNYSTTGHTHSNYSTTGHTHSYIATSNIVTSQTNSTTKVPAASLCYAMNTAYQTDLTNVTNGKSSIATAITNKGGSASGSDTFAQLATAITNININVNVGSAYSFDNEKIGNIYYSYVIFNINKVPNNYVALPLGNTAAKDPTAAMNAFTLFCIGKVNGISYGVVVNESDSRTIKETVESLSNSKFKISIRKIYGSATTSDIRSPSSTVTDFKIIYWD